MRWRMTGLDRASGQALELILEAADAQAAIAFANHRGFEIRSINPAPGGESQVVATDNVAPARPPPTLPLQVPQRLPRKVNDPMDRSGIIVLLSIIIAGISPFAPAVPIWIGGIIAVLVFLFIVPQFRMVLRPLFRVSRERPILGFFKQVGVLTWCLFFIVIGIECRMWQKGREAQQNVEAAANQQVTGLFHQAGTALRSKDITRANSLLSQAQNIQNATDSDGKAAIVDLIQKIHKATDPGKVRQSLLNLTDDDFDAFCKKKVTPASMNFEFPVLNYQEMTIAQPLISNVRVEREKSRQEAATKAAEDARQAKIKAAEDAHEAEVEAEKEAREAKARDDAERASRTITEDPIDANTLVDYYKTNEVRADNDCKNRWILVTGTVQTIGKDILDHPYVTLASSSDDITCVQCIFSDDGEIAKLANLSTGQDISIIGVCQGKMMNVLLEKSQIVSSERVIGKTSVVILKSN